MLRTCGGWARLLQLEREMTQMMIVLVQSGVGAARGVLRGLLVEDLAGRLAGGLAVRLVGD